MAIDMITAQIVGEYLETVSEEMSKTMERTALSTIFNEVHDYSTGIFYFDGKEVSLITRSAMVPPHIVASLHSVEALLKFFKNDLHDGDMILLNDPYFGGTHNADFTLMKPVFYQNKPVLFPSVRAHMADFGGPVASGYNYEATEVWQEGFRISPIKLYERGRLRRDVMDWLLANTRIPATLEGDLNAMIGACEVGERRVRALIDKYGVDTVHGCLSYILDYTERRARAEISKWPDGEYEGQSILDTDFLGNEDINVNVKMTVKGDELIVDFSGSHPQCPGLINSVPGNTISFVFCALTAVLPSDIPVNTGLFRLVTFHIPQGTVVNPNPPAPVMNSTVMIGADIAQAAMDALQKIVPERAGAVYVDFLIEMQIGNDSRYDNQMFVNLEYMNNGASASGVYGLDGWGAWPAPLCAMTFSTIEMLETQLPFIYWQAEFATDTAAPGQWRGVPAWHMKRQSVRDPAFLNISVQGAKHSHVGWAGGRPGVGNYYILDYGSPNQRVVRDVAPMYLSPPGQRTFAQKGGGGGWGDPFLRDPQMVLSDVLNEYVSIEGARKDYGVVIDPTTLEVDIEATRRLRSQVHRVDSEGRHGA